MKILYLANIRLPTEKAHGQQIMKMCEAFAALGHDVELVVPRKINSITADPFEYYPVKRNFKIRYLKTLDLIHFGQPGFFVSTIIFALSARIYAWNHPSDLVFTREPYLGTFFSGHALELHDMPAHIRGFTRFLWKRTSSIFVKTSFMKKELMNSGIPEQKIMVSMNGVDVGAFSTSISKADARKKLGLPLDKKIALYSGSFFVHEWKGVSVFLDSAQLLPSDVVIVLVGGSDSDVEKISEKHPGSKVIARSRTSNENIPMYLKAADVLVLPNRSGDMLSEYYTSPLKLFEYMAADVPVVASDLPAIREIVDASEALFVKPDDPKALAEGIVASLKDISASDARARRAFEKVKKLSWHERAAETLAFALKALPRVKDTAFYDIESKEYSEKRYPARVSSFIHYFFRDRLEKTLQYLKSISAQEPLDLLEIGCADGYVLSAISTSGLAIGRAVGIDISPKMIDEAKRRGPDALEYFVRGAEPDLAYDAIVEIGVANFTDLSAELAYAKAHLKPGGHFILSLASSTSLKNRSNPKWSHQYAHLRSFAEYEREISEDFSIISKHAYGLDIPLIWRSPALARVVQPVVESIIRPIAPDLFHEKVYLLSKRP